jgi:SAM-dependent methyltransferase
MKEKLRHHIKSIFEALGIGNLPFDVYACKIDVLPPFAAQVAWTHEFLICADCSQGVNYNHVKQRLHDFSGKEIYSIGKQCVYWFEGNSVIAHEVLPNPDIENRVDENIEYLKTSTRLPGWLDDFIFDRLEANHSPDHRRYESNLNLSEEETLIYLGTYFPRSYAESFCIFDNIFQNKAYKRNTFARSTLNILSVGCGTGGDLFGLLTAIDKYDAKVEHIHIWAIDGNPTALSILSCITDQFQSHSRKKIRLNIFQVTFPSIGEINLSTCNMGNIKFDFILSFKMICEIIARGHGAYDNSYYDFVKKFMPLLSEKGICVLLDVTTKTDHTTFNPILMNRQVNNALMELREYKTLLPLSCNLFENNCFMDCFSQQIFSVTHKRHPCDKSKVAYRVIAGRTFADQIAHPVASVQYIIQKSGDGLCGHTIGHENMADAYKLITSI